MCRVRSSSRRARADAPRMWARCATASMLHADGARRAESGGVVSVWRESDTALTAVSGARATHVGPRRRNCRRPFDDLWGAPLYWHISLQRKGQCRLHGCRGYSAHLPLLSASSLRSNGFAFGLISRSGTHASMRRTHGHISHASSRASMLGALCTMKTARLP